MSTRDDHAVAVGESLEAVGWTAEADRLLDRMAGTFARVQTRRRTRKFLFELLADLPRKDCWSITEHAGDTDPQGMQHLLGRAVLDTDGVRDDLRDHVVDQLGQNQLTTPDDTDADHLSQQGLSRARCN